MGSVVHFTLGTDAQVLGCSFMLSAGLLASIGFFAARKKGRMGRFFYTSNCMAGGAINLLGWRKAVLLVV